MKLRVTARQDDAERFLVPRLSTNRQGFNQLRALGLGSDARREERDEEHDGTRDLKRNACAVSLERRTRPDRSADPRETTEGLLDAHDVTELFRIASLTQERTRRGKQ